MPDAVGGWMTVHLYAQCWNDEWMLPFFFRHYDRLVDRYFIYDDGSADGTWGLLRSHPKVEARRFERATPESFVLSEQAFSNECWKGSRGEADWVILTDIDEHLFHPAGVSVPLRGRRGDRHSRPGLSDDQRP
jgi:Glycosyl transferase family 2